MEPVEEQERHIESLPDSEAEALLAAPSRYLFPIVTTALNTGLRKGEVFALNKERSFVIELARCAISCLLSKETLTDPIRNGRYLADEIFAVRIKGSDREDSFPFHVHRVGVRQIPNQRRRPWIFEATSCLIPCSLGYGGFSFTPSSFPVLEII